MARLSQLFRLQEVDEAILDGEARMTEIDDILAQDQAVAAALKAQERAQAELVAARNQFGEAEQAVEAQREKIERTDSALYGGAVQNPKELEELQQETASLKRYMSTLEDRYLDALAVLEEVETSYDSAKTSVAQAQQEATDRSADLSQERAAIAQDLERLGEEQSAAASDVGEAMLQTYRQVRRRVGRQPVAMIEDGGCGVCGMAVPGSTHQRVRSGDELHTCDQCGRILYAG